MTYTPIPKGTDPWDAQVNNAFIDQDARITSNAASIAQLRTGGGMPIDYGLQSWTYDPATAAAGVVPASGTVLMSKVYLNAGTVTAVGVSINAAGVTLTAGQNFMGLYDQGGTRIGVTADQSASWVTIGYKQISLVAPVSIVTSGFYYVAYLSNGATPAGITRGSNAGVTVPNLNLTVDQARFATGPTAQTTLPTSVTMSARTPIGQTYWMAVA